MSEQNSIFDVPSWATEYIAEWVERLQLGGWTVALRVQLVLDDDPDVAALCDAQSTLNFALISVRADIEDTIEWREYLLHELLHVAHARLDLFLEGAVFAQLEPAARAVVETEYTHLYESYICRLASALYGVAYPHGEARPDAANKFAFHQSVKE